MSNLVAKKKKGKKKARTQYDPKKVAGAIALNLFRVRGFPDIFRNGPMNEIIENENISGVDDRIIKCQAAQESAYNPAGVGSSGETGLLQVMPGTARGMGYEPDDLKEPGTGIRAGTQYLGELIGRYGDVYNALVVYNAGIRNYDNGRVPITSWEYADQILGCARGLGYKD